MRQIYEVIGIVVPKQSLIDLRDEDQRTERKLLNDTNWVSLPSGNET